MTSTLADLIAGIQLESVRLLHAETKTRLVDPRRVPPADLQLSPATKVLHRYDGGFMVAAMLRARVIASDEIKDPKAHPLVSFDVTFELHYTIRDAALFPDPVVGEFARLNGTFNAWPYWREFIQTTAARMGLPSLVLPVFRVGSVPSVKATAREAATPKTMHTVPTHATGSAVRKPSFAGAKKR